MTSTKDISTGLAKLIKATKKATLALASMGITLDRVERTEEWYNGLTPIEKIVRVIKYYPLRAPSRHPRQ